MAEFSVVIMLLYVPSFPQGKWLLAKQCIDSEKRFLKHFYYTLPAHCTGTLYQYLIIILYPLM